MDTTLYFNFFDGSISDRPITDRSLSATLVTFDAMNASYLNGSYVIRFHGICEGCGSLFGKRYVMFCYEYRGVEYITGLYAIEIKKGV